MKQDLLWKKEKLRKENPDFIQINLGNRCNQACKHCHIGAGPAGNKNMNTATAKKILQPLENPDLRNIEFTGGAPEMNPNLEYFIRELAGKNKSLTVRTNLTILDYGKYSFHLDLFRENGVKLVASLPGLFQETTDEQRGKGVFSKSLRILRKLNELGYGTNGLLLDLAYNPAGDFLPPDQAQLEGEYREILKEKYGIYFNNLVTLANSPIGKFGRFLEREDKLQPYLSLLKKNYNPLTRDHLMCKKLVSVDYAGRVYDCDFNLALNKRIEGYENIRFWEIDFNQFKPEVSCGSHCYACTVNQGSSCYGALVKKEKTGFDVKAGVRKYYGQVLKKTSDLKTNACCDISSVPAHIKNALTLINDEVKMKYYGCGSPIPLCVEGLKALDAGCGTGRDVYILSKLTGEKGFVSGIDMTENQLAVARKYIREHTGRFGYKKPNVEFVLDYMENIGRHFNREALDLVTSNCVINLAENKEIVLRQIFDVLKYGGEFYFSDVYTDRRVPEKVRKNPLLYNECLGGAFYYRDFEDLAKKTGWTDPRVVSRREIGISNPEIKKLAGNIKFFSITYRLWKLKDLDAACEDYGQIAVYKGGLAEAPFVFELDQGHIFEKNKPVRVCGNTVRMLSDTRFKKYFKILGSFREHFGLFENCSAPVSSGPEDKSGSCC